MASYGGSASSPSTVKWMATRPVGGHRPENEACSDRRRSSTSPVPGTGAPAPSVTTPRK